MSDLTSFIDTLAPWIFSGIIILLTIWMLNQLFQAVRTLLDNADNDNNQGNTRRVRRVDTEPRRPRRRGNYRQGSLSDRADRFAQKLETIERANNAEVTQYLLGKAETRARNLTDEEVVIALSRRLHESTLDVLIKNL